MYSFHYLLNTPELFSIFKSFGNSLIYFPHVLAVPFWSSVSMRPSVSQQLKFVERCLP
jgi:hypothetical protein